MLTCKEFVTIHSSINERSLRSRLAMRFHILICKHCRKYAKQLKILKLSLRKILRFQVESTSKENIRNLEKKIIENLK